MATDWGLLCITVNALIVHTCTALFSRRLIFVDFDLTLKILLYKFLGSSSAPFK